MGAFKRLHNNSLETGDKRAWGLYYSYSWKAEPRTDIHVVSELEIEELCRQVHQLNRNLDFSDAKIALNEMSFAQAFKKFTGNRFNRPTLKSKPKIVDSVTDENIERLQDLCNDRGFKPSVAKAIWLLENFGSIADAYHFRTGFSLEDEYQQKSFF